MNKLPELIEVGTIAKTHGRVGEIIVRFEKSKLANLEKAEYLFIALNGQGVPFRILDRNLRLNGNGILLLDGVADESEAKKLCNCPISIPKTRISKKREIDRELLGIEGFKVFTTDGDYIGLLDTMLDYSGNSLFRIMNDKKEILIPAQADFISAINTKTHTISLILPEGLLDLYN